MTAAAAAAEKKKAKNNNKKKSATCSLFPPACWEPLPFYLLHTQEYMASSGIAGSYSGYHITLNMPDLI